MFQKIKQSLINKLTIINKVNHKNCCNPDEDCYSWCKECVPRELIEGWTSENYNIDEFIKDTIYCARIHGDYNYPLFLEWVPFNRFEDVKQIGEGGFAKVFSATWIDGKSYYKYVDGSWKKTEPKSKKVALKRLNESNNISKEYLNEVQYVYLIMIIVNFYLIFNGADLALPFFAFFGYFIFID